MTIRTIACACILSMANLLAAATARYVGDGAAAVVSSRAALVYTNQVLATDAKTALDALDRELRDTGGDVAGVVKLHVAAKTQAAADAAGAAIRAKYPGDKRPAVTFVVGELARAEATVAIDAVALAAAAAQPPAPWSLVFIAGQAEKGATPAAATAKTLRSLIETLEFVGSKPADVRHARCFLTPMSAADAVETQVRQAFSESVAVSFVEWKSDLPVEIELVATAPPPANAPHAPAVEYLTQPGAKPSPLFARIARVNRGDLIFVGGLYAAKAGSGEQQVRSVFNQLDKAVTASGSDLKQLVKATYYVSDNDASGQLNALRPKYYDPQRPPAASKAMVPGVGMPQRSITVDMIAVTATP